MLNNFCFHVYAQKSLKCEWICFDLLIIITLPCEWTNSRAGSQLKSPHSPKTLSMGLDF